MDYSSAFNSDEPSGLDGFDEAQAAPEFQPLPGGIYECRVVRGEFCTTRAGADAFRLRFEVVTGEQQGKTLVRIWTFGAKALPYTKRDLAPFGLTTKTKLLSPFPEAGRDYLVRLVVALQRGNDGIERNDIKRIELLRIVESPAAAYMLPEEGEGGIE